jgi:hypothetical protein
MAGKPSPKRPAQPKMVQKRTGSAGPTKGDMATRGKRVSEAGKHGAKPGQQAPAAPTSPSGAPFPQKGRSQPSAPMRDSRAGIRDQASKGGSGSLFERMDARNRKLANRNRRTA